MKDNRSKKLFDAVGEIGDDLINEAESYDFKTERAKKIRKYSAVAASFILVAAVAVITIMTVNRNKDKSLPVPVTEPIEFAQDSAFFGSAASLPEELRNVSVVASDADGKIIPTESDFIVKTEKGCEVETLTEFMTLSPKTDYSVTKLGDGEFKVSPASGKLFPGTVYNVSFGDPENPGASYTFQTESEFFAKSVLPADMSTDVPVDTGIEITFSDSVGKCDFGDYISVEPEIELEFRVYPNGRVVAAIPKDDLEYGKVYTVTVKSGIPSLSGKELTEEKKTSFMTESSKRDDTSGSRLYISTSRISSTAAPSYRYSSNRGEYIYSPDEEAALTFSVFNYYEINSVEVGATLYRYPDAKSAAEAVLACATNTKVDREYTFSSDGLVKVGEYDASDRDDDEYSADGVISFGTGLEKGFYLAKLGASAKNRFGDRITSEKYIVIQITDLRAFTISSDGKTLVRVDSRSEKSADGAEVSSVSFNRSDWYGDEGDGETVATDSAVVRDGVCTLDTGRANSAVITITLGDDSAVICAGCAQTETDEFGMSHLYTDREKYFSDDTVNFSGFAVNLSGKSYPALYVKTAEAPAKQIEVMKNGYFRGAYAIENHSAGGIFLTVVDGDDNVVASKYIRVTEEEKPQITAALSFDKLFYRFGETVTVTLKATFFDGTPAEGFDFTLNADPFGESYTGMTTDKNGEISYSFETGRVTDPWSTDPSTITVYAELTGLETQTLFISSDVYYFHSDYVFKSVWEPTRRAVTLNKVDTSAIKTEDDLKYGVFPQNTVGEPADGTVNYVLKKYETIKKETKEYDYVAKRSYTRYTYDTVESTVETGTRSFENGVVELPMRKVEGFVGGYWYEVTYNDGRNNYKAYLSATGSEYWWSGDNEEYEITFDRDKYGAGDSFTADFRLKGAPVEDVLFAVYADGLEQFGKGASYTGRVEGAMVTGSEIYAVIFDRDSGQYLYDGAAIPFDPGESRLEIELTPDKETYAPGESATVKIKVKDAPGATLTLSVVDEACFALENQDEKSLEDYFSSVRKIAKDESRFGYFSYRWYDPWYGYGSSVMKDVAVNRRFTVSETVYGGGKNSTADADMAADEAVPEKAAETRAAEYAEEAAPEQNTSGSSEEEVYVRKYFADNPVFEVAELDGNGEATVVFTVPDNITSWRITAVAADGTGGEYDKVRLGNAVSDIICTKGFFINLSAPSYYIVGDDASLLARSFGIDSDGEVKYTAELADDAGNVVATASASDDSKGYAELNFGKVGEGHYTATVYAKGEKSSDALTSEFDVIRSAEMMPERRTVTFDEIKEISPALYPLTLTFYDGDSSHVFYGNVIHRLSWGDATARADMIAAKYVALKASERVFGADESDRIASAKESFSGYCGDLVSLLTYSEGDTELTANVLAVAPDLLTSENKSATAEYLTRLVMSTEQTDEVTLCAALSALASMNEPVLDVLYKTAQVAGGYPDDAKLYLAAAFASLGDWSAAGNIYSQVRDARAEEKAEYSTLCFRGDNDDETVRLSSLALLVSSRISKSDAEKTAKYLIENPSATEPDYLALAAYVRFFMPEGEYTEKTVSYRIGDKEYSETVTPWNPVSVRLSKTSHDSFEVIFADDGIAVDASYLAVASEVLENYDVSDRVTIEKEIKPYMNGMYKVVLKISGTSTRVSESFDITDVVPAGARYFSSYSNYDNEFQDNDIYAGAYVYNPAGQKVSGYVWICKKFNRGNDVYRMECPEYSFSVTATYVIRAAVKGEFIAEPAVIRNLGANIYYASARHRVTITDGEWIINKEN